MSPRRLLYACVTLGAMALVVVIFLVTLFGAQEPEGTDESSELKTNAQFYVVREGDALSVIAERTGIDEDRIEQLNPRLDPLALLPGERIRLRPPNAAELRARRARARAREPRRSSYVLKEGDLLSEVADDNNLDLSELLDLNPQIKRPDRVKAGQRIKLR
jgi:LysM repeat protein